MQNEEKETKDFSAKFEIKSQLPVITGNIEEIKTELSLQLKQFNLIVDEDSIKTAKAMATKINLLSGKINALRISKSKELSAPIKVFEAQANELTALCQTTRQNLLSQVKVFEDKTRAECLVLLQEKRDTSYLKYEIRDEFKTVMVEDLAIVSNKNKSGLAKKANDAIEERVFERKQFQDKINNRLMTLVGTCYESGLEAPLTRENISHFLLEVSDDAYNTKLQSMISNEITRLHDMQKRIDAKVAIEAAKKVAPVVVQQEIVTPPSVQTNQVSRKSDTDSKYANYKNNVFAPVSTKRSYTVTATFEIVVEEKLEAKLEGMLLKKFQDAKFKTTPTILITKGVEDVKAAA